MFNIPGSSPLKATNSAIKQISYLLKKNNKFALRIGLKKGGCAGMEYTMEFIDNLEQADELIDLHGAKIVVAPSAQMFLFGSEIDYEVGVIESGFKFRNPNVKESCGCGESVKF